MPQPDKPKMGIQPKTKKKKPISAHQNRLIKLFDGVVIGHFAECQGEIAEAEGIMKAKIASRS